MGCISTIVLVVIAVALSMVGGALIVSASSAIFLHLPFSTGWHDAWQRPGMLAFFGIFVAPFLSFASFTSSD